MRAAQRWRVLELVVAPRQRTNLIARLGEVAPFDVVEWPNRVDVEVASATEWRRAIVEGRVAHDGHATLAEHVQATVVQATSDGSLRLDRAAGWAAGGRRSGGADGVVAGLDVASRLESPAIY